MQYYVPFAQLPKPPAPDPAMISGILVQTTGDPDALAGPVQRMVQGASPAPVYARVTPYEDLLNPQMRPWRLGATLFGALAGLALAIATVGLIGVVSFIVAQRRGEIGVRLALGSSPGAVARLVVGSAVGLVGAGALAGLAAAFIAAPLMRSMLFETSPRDTGVFMADGVALLLVAVASAALPAWRAARVDPLEALRTD